MAQASKSVEALVDSWEEIFETLFKSSLMQAGLFNSISQKDFGTNDQ